MSDELKKQLNNMGVWAIQTWHIVLLIIAIILSAGATWGNAVTRISALEEKTLAIEKEVKEMHQTEIDISRIEAKLDMLIKELKGWK